MNRKSFLARLFAPLALIPFLSRKASAKVFKANLKFMGFEKGTGYGKDGASTIVGCDDSRWQAATKYMNICKDQDEALRIDIAKNVEHIFKK